MKSGFLNSVFGNGHGYDIKSIMPILHRVNSLESWALSLAEEEFSAQTKEFRQKLAAGEKEDNILPQAFALAREAARRALGERPYDVQILGAIVLHQGKITEMKTGEGKTLASIAAAYLNSLSGKGVHVVTVNDYLAERDSRWMRPVYSLLGITVGNILSGMDNATRHEQYSCDIVYATNNELGFDYLRDNMAIDPSQHTQRGYHFAIIDEIDSILIDEARTPLIISGAVEEDVSKYILCNRLAAKLHECEKDPETGTYPPDDPIAGNQAKGDYKLEEKSKRVLLTNEGMNHIEKILLQESLLQSGSLFDEDNFEYIHYFTQALKAQNLFRKDKDYVIQDKQVQIVDEFTGRILQGRRYSDGLHQAIEAREKIRPARKNRTLATITFQNFFRMYTKISGMTGTAETEAREFRKIYGMDVTVIPTNRPVNRIDEDDIIFLNEDYKFKAICEEVARINKTGQPILVGTASVEKSEKLSKYLTRKGIRHEVLNAKNHHREALIIAEAGARGAVTIATNMAGRGTDIKLGGNPDFRARHLAGEKSTEEKFHSILEKEKQKWIFQNEEIRKLGGLCIIGTERHESRRIDNQLRGRSGRQGDPGNSRFYISLEDDLMRLFGGDNFRTAMARLGMGSGEPLQHSLINRSIERAQKRVEDRNYDIRKHLLDYDDVLNRQRQRIYSMRDELLTSGDKKHIVMETARQIVDVLVDDYQKDGNSDTRMAFNRLRERLVQNFNYNIDGKLTPNSSPGEASEIINQHLREEMEQKCHLAGEEQINAFIRYEYMNQIDRKWQEHLEELTSLSDSVRLRSYAQKNPLVEYKNEGFEIFNQMIEDLRINMARTMFRINIRKRESREEHTDTPQSARNSIYKAIHSSMPGMTERTRTSDNKPTEQIRRKYPKVGRNTPCPCGSKKKYKNCCGR